MNRPRGRPTAYGWMIGRTQTSGKADHENVYKCHSGLKAIPLSAWGKEYTRQKGKIDLPSPAWPRLSRMP
jgi:hypothetical protein